MQLQRPESLYRRLGTSGLVGLHEAYQAGDPLVKSGVASPVVMTDLDNEVLSFEFAGPPDGR